MSQPDIDPVAWADQNAEGYKELGRVYAAFYNSLIEKKVPQSAATQITVAFIEANAPSRPRD